MRKTTFGFVVIVLVSFSSCRKHTSGGPSNGGSWTIKGTTYNADSCTITTSAPYSDLVAQTPINSGTISTYSQMVIGFGSVPSGTSTYILIPDSVFNNGIDSDQIFLYVTTGGLTNTSSYQSTSGAVSVTLSSGKISATATNILVQNSLPPYDTARLTFNVTQTN